MNLAFYLIDELKLPIDLPNTTFCAVLQSINCHDFDKIVSVIDKCYSLNNSSFSIDNDCGGITIFGYICNICRREDDYTFKLIEHLLRTRSPRLDIPTTAEYGYGDGMYPLYLARECTAAVKLLLYKYNANPKLIYEGTFGSMPFAELAVQCLDEELFKYGFKNKLIDMNARSICDGGNAMVPCLMEYARTVYTSQPLRKDAIAKTVVTVLEHCTEEQINAPLSSSKPTCNSLCMSDIAAPVWESLVNCGINVEPCLKCKTHKKAGFSQEFREFLESVLCIELHYFNTSQQCYAFSKESLWNRLKVLMKPERSRFYVEVQVKKPSATGDKLVFVDLDDIEWSAIPNNSVMKAVVPVLFVNMTRKQMVRDVVIAFEQ